LQLIKNINENLYPPKNLVGLNYALTKYKIHRKQIEFLMKEKLLQPHSFRASRVNVLSNIKDQPYFVKKDFDKCLLKIVKIPKNIFGVQQIYQRFNIQNSSIYRWIKYNFIKPDYILRTKKNLNEMPYFKIKGLEKKINKAKELASKKKVKDNLGKNNPMYGKNLSFFHKKKISLSLKGIPKPRVK
jgi:hypothetical protein